MPRVLITDYPWGNLQLERELLESAGYELVTVSSTDEQSLAEAVQEADAIEVCWAPLPASVIAVAKKCKIIARIGIGLDNIDVAAASAAGILVTNVPDYCLTEVADHTLAALLAWERKIVFYTEQVRAGVYELNAGHPVRRLSQLTLGLAGLGRIARTVIPRAQAFGLNLIGWSRSSEPVPGVRRVSWEELLEQSDYLSLHVPLSEQTFHLMNREAFERMKPTAVLINTSRGGLVDQSALWEALEGNQLAGAALDVFEQEPPDVSHPLFRDPRVLITPHAAFNSEQSLEEARRRVCQQILDGLAGRLPENLVNRQDLHLP